MSKVNVEYDLTPAMVEGAIRNKLIEMGWTPPQKPKQEIIKLGDLVGSDILCEFYADSTTKIIDKLIAIRTNTDYKYETENEVCDNCRIMEDHWFYEPNGWGECPIPSGLKVILRSQYGGEDTTTDYINLPNWKYGSGDGTIIAINVIGTAANARYEWEKEE